MAHSPQVSKKQKQSNEDIVYSTPKGLIWDGVDYSCAYDALFSILHNIWLSDRVKLVQILHRCWNI